jgi:hypothetical protein
LGFFVIRNSITCDENSNFNENENWISNSGSKWWGVLLVLLESPQGIRFNGGDFVNFLT